MRVIQRGGAWHQTPQKSWTTVPKAAVLSKPAGHDPPALLPKPQVGSKKTSRQHRSTGRSRRKGCVHAPPTSCDTELLGRGRTE